MLLSQSFLNRCHYFSVIFIWKIIIPPIVYNSRLNCFEKKKIITVNAIRRKGDSPVSLTNALWKLWGTLVNIKSIHVGFSKFLKRVGCLIRCFRDYLWQNDFTCCSLILVLKSSKNIILFYVGECMYIGLLIASRLLRFNILWRLYEQRKFNSA